MQTKKNASENIGDRFKEIRGHLLVNGRMTLEEFSKRHGFNTHTVKTVIRRHWGVTGTRPRGKSAIRILESLNKYVEG